MNEVKDWYVKVKSQKKTEKGNVIMNAMLTSKNDKGGWYDPVWLSIVVNAKTDWVKADYEGTYVLVSGRFTHSDYEGKNGKKKDFTIFADSVKKYENHEKKTDKEGDKY